MWLLALNEMQRKEYEEEQRITREREQQEREQQLQQQKQGILLFLSDIQEVNRLY